tara:strand:- start:180 stop:371 length:192 start_codon:yes stop_codon:yes gene_type:complete
MVMAENVATVRATYTMAPDSSHGFLSAAAAVLFADVLFVDVIFDEFIIEILNLDYIRCFKNPK